MNGLIITVHVLMALQMLQFQTASIRLSLRTPLAHFSSNFVEQLHEIEATSSYENRGGR
jgi:hypothetical protein